MVNETLSRNTHSTLEYSELQYLEDLKSVSRIVDTLQDYPTRNTRQSCHFKMPHVKAHTHADKLTTFI